MASCASAVAVLVAIRGIPLLCGRVGLCMYVGNLSMGLTAHLGRHDVKPALYRRPANSAAPALLRGLSCARRFHSHYTGHPRLERQLRQQSS